jgi:hypothetical protein
MHRLLYIIFFILTANLCYGGNKPPDVKKPVVHPVLKADDSSAVSVRHFDAAALKAYSKQPEFQYNEVPEHASWWTRFWRWVWHGFAEFWAWILRLLHLSAAKGGHVSSFWYYLLKYTLIVLGIAAVAFLALKLAGVDMANIFRKKSAAVAIPYSEFFEDINGINFDEEIENAVAKNNYRFAVRLLYLKCLKQLSDAGMIEWQIDKTNSIYINELKNDEQRSAFKQLTRQFEYVWYGEFSIDAPVYQNINLSFNDFNKRVA